MPTTPAYQSESVFDAAIDGGAGINNSRSAASITAGEVNALLKNLFRSFDVAVDKSDAASAGVAIQINAARDGLEIVPATRRLPDVPTGQNASGILKTADGAPPAYADVAAADLSSEIREELVNSFALTIENGQIRIVLTDGQGGTARDESAPLPTADTDNAGIVQIATLAEAQDSQTTDKVLTPQRMFEGLDGRILSGALSAANAGMVLEVDSQGHVTLGVKGTGPKGDTGDKGDKGDPGDAGNPGAPGASASIYAVRYYQTNNSATPPAAPTSASDANWATSLTAPSASARYAWQAIGVGDGTLSAFADVDAWLILPAGVFASTSGGSTPPVQDHAIYLAYAPADGDHVFVGNDFTNAARAVNNSADTTNNIFTAAELASGSYRQYAIAIPTNKTITHIYTRANGITNTASDQISVWPLQSGTVTIPPSTAHKVYRSNRNDINLSHPSVQLVIETEDA